MNDDTFNGENIVITFNPRQGIAYESTDYNYSPVTKEDIVAGKVVSLCTYRLWKVMYDV